MDSKQRRESQATYEAATLARIAMRLQRGGKKHVGKLLEDADACLKRYKMAHFVGDDKAVGTIGDKVAEDLKASMQALGDVVKETIAPRAYCLLVFGSDDLLVVGPDGVGKAGDELAYVSNANRDDICEAMRQFIVAHEKSK